MTLDTLLLTKKHSLACYFKFKTKQSHTIQYLFYVEICKLIVKL